MTADNELALLIKELPADSYDAGQEICRQLLSGGAATIERLVEMVGDQFGDSAGVQPKYALHGLVHYASRPGADSERKLLADTLVTQLKGDHSDELKAFIIRQLQLCGREEDIQTLAVLLSDKRLCKPAVQAITAIGGDRALKALRDALSNSDAESKLAIEQAIESLSRK